MSYVHRTIVVTAAQAPLARSLCEQLAGPPGAGMFLTALSPSGAAPATHYVSAGQIDQSFAAALGNAAILFGACQQAGIAVTQAQCTSLLSSSDVSGDQPFVALARMGLQMVQVAAAG